MGDVVGSTRKKLIRWPWVKIRWSYFSVRYHLQSTTRWCNWVLLTCCPECRCHVSFWSRGVWWGCSGWSQSRVAWAHSLVLQEQQERQEVQEEEMQEQQEQLLPGRCCCGNWLCRRQRGDRWSLGWRRGWWESTSGSDRDGWAWLKVRQEEYWSIDWSIHPEKTNIYFAPQLIVLNWL